MAESISSAFINEDPETDLNSMMISWISVTY